MNFNSILIITYGRSGSTLLQGILNSIDGCLVRGENFNFVYALYQAYVALARSKKEHGAETEPHFPWYGAHVLDEARFLADARTLVYNQLIGDQDKKRVRCLGFKEIRYYDVLDLQEYLLFLAKLFPEPAFLVLSRDHAQVTKSGWWSADADAKLAEFESSMRDFAQGKPWVFQLDYRDIVERTGRLQELFSFLGAPYDAERIEKVLSIPHSFTPSGKINENIAPNADAIQRCPHILYLALDPLPAESGFASQPFTVGGVLVLRKNAEKGNWRLLAEDANGKHSVQWGLPAPKMAQIYPENPHAPQARFKTEALVAKTDKSVLILLESPSGESWNVAKVALKG